MRRRGQRIITTVAAASCCAPLAACGVDSGVPSSTTTTARHDCGTPTATAPAVRTTHYLVVATVEPYQAMYTPAQVKAQHAKTGEVILRGGMPGGAVSAGQVMSAAKGQRHLEIKICSLGTGRVVDGHPKISLVDISAPHAMRQTLAAHAMKGIGKSGRDLHYGDNVALTAGHDYALTVRIGLDRAQLKMRLRSGQPPVRI